LKQQTESISLAAVICTRNRPEQLQRALLSLTNQTHPLSEIIVVDNAPSDDTTRILVTQQFSDVRYIREPIPGIDSARNRGLHESNQDIVALIDDDAVADRNWSKEIVRVFRENPAVGVCTGCIHPLSLETEAQRLFEANGGFLSGEVPIRLPRDGKKPLHGMRAPLITWAVILGIGCNMALRRSVALSLGGFDETLEMGKVLAGGGDVDMLWRILTGGLDVQYEPRIMVWHEHRRELHGFFEQILGHQLGMLAFLIKTVTCTHGWRRLSVLVYLIWRLLKPGARIMRHIMGRDPLPVSFLLRMWWSCWRGVADYPKTRRLVQENWGRPKC